ncbi:MAG: DUF4364 family protein [Ruthenibacterium sp.]
MANDAFTAGVKPGGLNSSTEIRILLCYLMRSAPAPLSKDEIQQALLGEELVNYFELADSLANLCEHGCAKEENGRYVLQPQGENIADTLGEDVPRSVRETAVRAAVYAQQLTRKTAQHKVRIDKTMDGFMVHCAIDDCGSRDAREGRSSEVFRFSLFMPDLRSAELVKRQFIERGDTIYTLMLAGVTGNAQLIEKAMTAVQKDSISFDKK